MHSTEGDRATLPIYVMLKNTSTNFPIAVCEDLIAVFNLLADFSKL
jgi:hypothetical protein